jgi:hypothetical protein
MGLNRKKIDLLREFVNYICEECHRHEDRIGRLGPHRLNRKGEYSMRNIKMVCNYKGKIDNRISCHKAYHSGEFKCQK